jgi:DNA-binding response OmpR family regulator
MRALPPDIVLLGTEWRSRALIRAQLIEEGFAVLATDDWATMRRHLRPGSKPSLAIVDLHGLSEPMRVLTDLKVLMKPTRVLVLAGLGTIPPIEIEQLGFRVIKRPIAVGDVVAAAAAIVNARRRQPSRA